ncbi:hypothetical protein DB32_004687 [Sandaracinus amylolyticus]|uniref:Uncharacterized protein n=1 Tax=Sandaracinus amylolyticus TaxID=927083 RepID=A0A0F6YJ54_9BACT|nr:hypothetical protein DB32_004687 [Sandaracinus amylolyticus]
MIPRGADAPRPPRATGAPDDGSARFSSVGARALARSDALASLPDPVPGLGPGDASRRVRRRA